METAQTREMRWHPVPFWGMGWTAGAVALGVAFWLFAEQRAVWLSFLLLPIAGAAAFGLPTYIGARRTGSRAPSAQAFVWVVGFTIAGVLLMNTFGDHHRLAEPGDLNINTRETMRERQAGPYFLSSAGCRLRRGMYGRGHYGICARYTTAERVRPPKAVRSSALASCH